MVYAFKVGNIFKNFQFFFSIDLNISFDFFLYSESFKILPIFNTSFLVHSSLCDYTRHKRKFKRLLVPKTSFKRRFKDF